MGIMISVIGGMLFIGLYIINISMAISDGSGYVWGSYRKFKEQYMKYNWEIEYSDKCFFMDRSRFDYGSKLHAGICVFGGKGMLLDPVSMVLSSIFMIKQQKTKEKVKW